MNNSIGFFIENGILKKYMGSDEDILIIPKGVKEIENGSFACGGVFTGNKRLKKVVLPEGIENIGDYAFQDCSSLEEINFPHSIVRIGWFAFSKCSKIKKLDLPDDIVEIGEAAFEGLRKITQVQIPSGVERLSATFMGCSKLENVLLQQGLKEILSGAFQSCSSLREITIPIGVIKIGDDAFRKCKQLEKVIIPPSVMELGNGCFRDCPSLTEIDLPKHLNTSLKRAFDKKDLLNKYIHGHIRFSPVTEKAFVSQMLEKGNRKQFITEWIKDDDAESMSWLLKNLKKTTSEELETYIAAASAQQKTQIVSMLIDCVKNITVDDDMNNKRKDDLRKPDMTLEDWRKIFKFSVKEGKAKISGYKALDKVAEITIPKKIGNNQVTEVDLAISNREFLETIRIPEGVMKVELLIEQCKNLKDFYLPKSVDGRWNLNISYMYCPPITIHAPAGSYAERYANDRGIQFVAEIEESKTQYGA